MIVRQGHFRQGLYKRLSANLFGEFGIEKTGPNGAGLVFDAFYEEVFFGAWGEVYVAHFLETGGLVVLGANSDIVEGVLGIREGRESGLKPGNRG